MNSRISTRYSPTAIAIPAAIQSQMESIGYGAGSDSSIIRCKVSNSAAVWLYPSFTSYR